MLHHSLRGANKKRLIYVGGTMADQSTTGDLVLSLTSLTGGVASSPAAGDLVIVAFAGPSLTNKDLTMVTTGYTELADLWSIDTNYLNLGIFAKVMGATPDTTVRASNPYIFGAYGIGAHVWRGTNIASGLVTPVATATGTNTGVANPPSVTPTVARSVIIVIGAGTSNGTVNSYTAPSGITHLVSHYPADPSLAIGANVNWSSGAYDCAAFGEGSTSTSDAWAAASIILKPV